MNFKVVSKNNMGVVTLLVLIILLTQSRVFNFLLDSHLGRTVLLAVIIFLSYLNKILGTVAVLMVAILISTSNYDYLEGFNNNVDKNNSNDSNNTNESMDKKKDVKVGDRMVSDNSTQNKDQNQLPRARIVQQIKKSNEMVSSDESEPVTEGTSTEVVAEETTTSVEGFNILSMENDIRRGKNSNSIPVNSFMRNSDTVSPFEFSNFGDNFMSL